MSHSSTRQVLPAYAITMVLAFLQQSKPIGGEESQPRGEESQPSGEESQPGKGEQSHQVGGSSHSPVGGAVTAQ